MFTIGGGYAMLSLIQNEVVTVHGWIDEGTFTDIVAVSQMTPGRGTDEFRSISIRMYPWILHCNIRSRIALFHNRTPSLQDLRQMERPLYVQGGTYRAQTCNIGTYRNCSSGTCYTGELYRLEKFRDLHPGIYRSLFQEGGAFLYHRNRSISRSSNLLIYGMAY